jgi:hypothetical protein
MRRQSRKSYHADNSHIDGFIKKPLISEHSEHSFSTTPGFIKLWSLASFRTLVASMVVRSASSHSETEPLLQPSATHQVGVPGELNAPQEFPPPLNKYSVADICWILAGIWSGVFLGAVDGWFNSFNWIQNRRINKNKFVFDKGTIVATLLAPIGGSFNKFNQSSYIGTSYLLSVCCFTPLYGMYIP